MKEIPSYLLAPLLGALLETPEMEKVIRSHIQASSLRSDPDEMERYSIEFSHGDIGPRRPYGQSLYFDAMYSLVLRYGTLPIACASFTGAELWRPPELLWGIGINQIQGVRFTYYGDAGIVSRLRRGISGMRWEEALVKSILSLVSRIPEVHHVQIKTAVQNEYFSNVGVVERLQEREARNQRLLSRYDATAKACDFEKEPWSFVRMLDRTSVRVAAE